MTRQTARRWSCGCAAALACVSLLWRSSSGAELYRLAQPTSYDTPNGVSPDGSIVLTTEYVWTPSGGMVRFAPEQGTYSRDISNNGIVVGLTDGAYEPFRSPIGGPVEPLATAGDAFGITPDGSVIVGYAYFSNEPIRIEAFRWTAQTGIVSLGRFSPGSQVYDTAFGVSADGSVIVGEGGVGETHEAFRWTQATGMVGLGELPGGDVHSSARAVSADGQVIVGHSLSGNGTEAFRWTQASGMVGLGDLPGGNFYSLAHATTADGAIVVGTSDGDAFIWTAADGMRNLQDVLESEYGLGPALAGLDLSSATDISHDGRVIVGYGYNTDREQEGFVAIIPEPAAGLAGAIALLGIGGRRRSRV